MNFSEAADILEEIDYPGFIFHMHSNGNFSSAYLQIICKAECNITGKEIEWHSRKWKLSQHMTKSEFVQTAFKAVLTAIEHEAREKFKYRGVSIFDPHYDVDRLVELRSDPTSISEREEIKQ